MTSPLSAATPAPRSSPLSTSESSGTSPDSEKAKTVTSLARRRLKKDFASLWTREQLTFAKWKKRALEDEEPGAQHNLALCFLDGIGIEQDQRKAVFWFLQAAKQGLAKAQFNLAYAYEKEIGIDPDPENRVWATYWLGQAAIQGHVKAQYNLAVCYEEGFGVEKNLEHALYYYQQAAAQGDEQAKARVSVLTNSL